MSVEQMKVWRGGKDHRLFTDKIAADVYDYLEGHSGLDKDKCDLVARTVTVWNNKKAILEILKGEYEERQEDK